MLIPSFLIMIMTMASAPAAMSDKRFTDNDTQVVVTDDNKRRHIVWLSLSEQHRIQILCRKYTFKQMLVWSKSKGSAGFHISCEKGRSSNRKLVIWLHGGPWTHASRSLVLEQFAFMEAGYDLFIPLYAGSADRPVRFEGPVMVPDVVDALVEVKAAYQWGRRHYEAVDIYGESFGTFLAASLAPELKGQSSLFLHNPSLGGQRRLMEYYSSHGDTLIEGVSKEAAQAEARRITEAYFGRLRGYAPLELLESTKGLKLKLVYGGRDELMDLEEIRRLARLAVPDCGIDYRPDNAHESGKTPEQYEGFRNLIRCGEFDGRRSVPRSGRPLLFPGSAGL